MKSALLRIITNQSAFPSLTEISLTGHSNISGTNGAGKTSSLVLVPVFYGIDPQYMVREKPKTFLDFYLSKARSFVIFEYQRQDQISCVVLYRHNNTLHYRFVKGDADSTLFTEQSKMKLNNAENIDCWLSEDIAQITEVSRQIKTIKDYCAIIQHNLSHLSPIKARQSGLKDIADKFSLCRPGKSMRHIERLTSVMHKKTRLMEGLKDMVADCFIDSQLDVGKAPYNDNDTLTIDALSALERMMSHQSEFESAIQAYGDIKSVWSLLLSHTKQLDEHKLVLSSEQERARSLLTELRDQIRITQKTFDAKISETQGKVNDLNDSFKHLERVIEHLYAKRDEYDELDLVQKIAAYNELHNLEVIAQDAVKHHVMLLDSVKEESNAYQAQSAKVSAQASQRRETLSVKIDAVKSEKAAHQKQVNDGVMRIERETTDAIKQYESKRSEKRDVHVSAINQAVRAEEKARYITQEENLALLKLQEHRNAIDEEINELKIKHKQTQNAFDDILTKRQSYELHRLGLGKKLDSCETQIEDVRNLLSPNKNSLRAYLADNIPDWRKTFGKLLSAEALNNSKLNPVVVDTDATRTVFGITLEIENLDLPEYAQPNELLDQRLMLLLRDKDVLLEEIKSCESEISLATSQSHKFKSELGTCESRQDALWEMSRQLKLERDKLESEFKTEQENRLDAASKALKEAERALSAFDSETASTASDMRLMGNEQRLQYSSREAITSAEFEVTIQHLLTQIDENKRQESIQLAELKSMYDSMLRSKNIDDKAVTEAKRRAEEARILVEEVREYRKIISEFQAWKDTQWVTLEGKEKECHRVEVLLREEQVALKLLKEERGAQLASLNRECDTTEEIMAKNKAKLADIDARQGDVSEHLKHIPYGHSPDPLIVDISLDLLLTQCSDSCNNSRKLTARIKKAVATANEILSEGDSRNAITDAWVQYKLEYDKLRVSGSERDIVFDRADALERLVRESIPNITRLQLENMKMLGQRYVRFYESLNALNHKVKSVSTMLGEQINVRNKFPGIADIRIILKSKFEEYEIWPVLKQMTLAWNEWIESGQHELPDDSLLQATLSAVDAMKNGGMRRFQSDNVSQYIELHLSFSENGNKPMTIKNDDQFINSSSTGLTELALLAMFGGMTRFLCTDDDVLVHWPMDEMGRLHDENITRIFDFMDSEGITLFCAEPKLNQVHRQRFTNKYRAVPGKGIERFQYADGRTNNRILDEERTHA